MLGERKECGITGSQVRGWRKTFARSFKDLLAKPVGQRPPDSTGLRAGLYCPRPDERGVRSRPKLPMSGRRSRGRRRVGSSTASHQASQSRLRAGVFDPSWLRGETNAAGIASGHNRRVQGLIGKALTRCTGHHWQWSQGPWGFPLGASISNSNRHIGKKRPIGARATSASPQQCGTGLPKAVTHAPRSIARGGRLRHPRR